MSKSPLREHKEIRWTKHLNSYQLWSTIVDLLYEAAAPLAVYANMSMETALSCLALSTDNRRKITEEAQDELMVQLFDELAQRVDYHQVTEESKLLLLEFILYSGIERNIVVDHIAYTLRQPRAVPEPINVKKLFKHVRQYLANYEEFKQDILFRYYYFIQTFAHKNQYSKETVGLHTTQTDMLHAYMISSFRAIDRFIPTKGTLTSQIESWFKHAEGASSFVMYDNEAYSLNRNVRKSIQDGSKPINNKAISIHDREDSIADESPLEMSVFPEFSRHIAKLPNASLVFVAQNIPYTLNKDQVQRIYASNKEQAAKALLSRDET
jgi:hypothetical protein